MKILTEAEKIDYIKNNFHQYFDIKLNENLTTTETVNLVIPISSLQKENPPEINENSEEETTIDIYEHDISIPENLDINTEILGKYENTDILPTTECFNIRVIDGDTFWADIAITDNEETILQSEKIRLVGIDTPEMNDGNPAQGAEDSKKFLEKVTTNKRVYIHIDSIKPRDNYNRILAVLIVDNKNINEIMLKHGIARVMYIPPCEFNSFDWKKSSTPVYTFNSNNINYLSQYFNPTFTNIVFSQKDNNDILYPFEVYKNVFFIKLKPYSQNIRMHLLPREYKCDNNILLFKDDMIQRRTITNSSNYKIYENKNNINAYYQVNAKDRNRNTISNNDKSYNPSSFEQTKTWVEFDYDISDLTENMNNLMICSGYRYNYTSPYYAVHYIGIKDKHDKLAKDKCTLIDANWDDALQDKTKTNHITKMEVSENDIITPNHTTLDNKSLQGYANIDGRVEDGEDYGRLYHKILKYIGPNLYTEEERNTGWMEKNW